MACTGAGAPGRARPSGSSGPSFPASPPAASIGAVRRATIAPMCASANGRRRIRSGSGSTGRRRWLSSRELAQASKIERATVLGLAAADLLVRGGERVGLIGLTRPLATRGVIERFAEAIALDERLSRRSAAVAAVGSA